MKKITVTYKKTEQKEFEAENSFDASNVAEQNCPNGYKVLEWCFTDDAPPSPAENKLLPVASELAVVDQEKVLDAISCYRSECEREQPSSGYEYGILENELKEVGFTIVKIRDLTDLQHQNDRTAGLYAFSFDPSELLHRFWNLSSDACLLEASEQEKQEIKWKEFIKDLAFQILPVC